MQGYMVTKWHSMKPNQDLNQKCMILNVLLQSRLPAVLARLRTGPLEIYEEWTEGLLEDEGVSRLDVFSTNSTSPQF